MSHATCEKGWVGWVMAVRGASEKAGDRKRKQKEERV